MDEFPQKLWEKLELRRQEDSLRKLSEPSGLIDFSSNDYLGLARLPHNLDGLQRPGGSTSSRLIRGNHKGYNRAEALAARYHQAESALIFNSGYDANLSLLASVPQRTDIIFYDQQAHASIRDGIRLSQARAYSFQHNNLAALLQRYQTVFAKGRSEGSEVYVVTESVFSMEGDGPPLEEMMAFCEAHHCRLILDEAHATGVLGPGGRGMAAALGLEGRIFARVVTYGKAMGSHGAAVLGSQSLRDYLINFARSLIYTTALPPESLARISWAYELLSGPEGTRLQEELRANCETFRGAVRQFGLEARFRGGLAAIFAYQVGGNARTRSLAAALAQHGYDVRAILAPTVPPGEECLRFCLHSFNTEQEIMEVLRILSVSSEGTKHE